MAGELFFLLDAMAMLKPGENIKDRFRVLYFEQWNDDINDTVTVARRYQELGNDPPPEYTINGERYRVGQVSGPAMLWITYDHLPG